MEKLNMEKAIEQYNDVMYYICVEHQTIGTRYSEDTENYNLRDMVAECDYWLSCYYEEGNCRCDDKSNSKEEYQVWVEETTELKNFIKTYKPFIKNMTCTSGHCSQYD